MVSKNHVLILVKSPFVGEFIRKVHCPIHPSHQSINKCKSSFIKRNSAHQKMIDYYPLQVGLESIEKDILLGKSFYECVEAVSIFDKKMASLIKVRRNQQNETIFKRITAQYHQEISTNQK